MNTFPNNKICGQWCLKQNIVTFLPLSFDDTQFYGQYMTFFYEMYHYLDDISLIFLQQLQSGQFPWFE